ncbi:MAG: sugar ABC transporter ATP-binding protein [Treponema sp.]|jgi:ribose transport system ATP-binding protein|nr:sugar ABC transporter ATP-binding protein [Treponema sp.]
MEEHRLLQMEGISKNFHQVRALDNVQLELNAGEILALLGENGAGKSTLMKILSGSVQADSGSIKLEGTPVHILSPAAARRLGIGVIYQELMLAMELSVAENIFMGREPGSGILFDWKTLNRKAQELLDSMGIAIDPKELMMNLTVSQRQLIEIAKALSQNPRILIMDEPTSALPESEVDGLLERICALRDAGMGIIYISHKMGEIKRIADRATVLRDGHYIGSLSREEIDINRIIAMMVGRDTKLDFHRLRESIEEETALEVRKLCNYKIKDVSFRLRRREIIGIAGLMGSGRSELMRAIFGIDPVTSGELYINGKKCEIGSPSGLIRLGTGLAPEDRKEQALFLDMNIENNISIARLYRNKGGIRRKKRERELALEYAEKLNIATPGTWQEVKRLSGGNQQKVVIARWLANSPDILLLDEPTRGIDVGAKTEIYELLSSLSRNGVSIIVVSSEMSELLAIADRILVMHEGALAGEMDITEATQERIMALATGQGKEGPSNMPQTGRYNNG